MLFCCECYVLSGRNICDELIARPEEFYPLWCVAVCNMVTSTIRKPWPALTQNHRKITRKHLKKLISRSYAKILESVLTQILQACQIVKDNYKKVIKRSTSVLSYCDTQT